MSTPTVSTSNNTPFTIPYTTSEKTVKKYTPDQAIKAAQAYLIDRYGITEVCNMRLNRHQEKLLTLVGLSDLIEELIDDTLWQETRLTKTTMN